MMAVNPAIFPVPLAARPMDVLLLVHVYAAPCTAEAKYIMPVVAPLQTRCPAGTVTAGIGFTVMVKDFPGPAHPFNSGITVMVAVTGKVVLLMAVKDGMFPVPDGASPINVLLFVQWKAVPGILPAKLTTGVAAFLQKTRSAG